MIQSLSFKHSTAKDAIESRLFLVRRVIEKFKRNPDLRVFALSVVQGLNPSRANLDFEVASRIFKFMRTKVPYRRDIEDIETIQEPFITLRYGGDCDCLCGAAGALLESLGVKVYLGISSQGRVEYDHIFLVLFPSMLIFDVTQDMFPADRGKYNAALIPELNNR